MTALTRDSISLRGAGIVSVIQLRSGLRFTVDSLLLADFCRIRAREMVLEPGAGTGVISLLLAKKFPSAEFTSIELEPRAYGLLCRNIEENGLSGRVAAVNADIRSLATSADASAFDAIVANPPYTAHHTGRSSPLAGRRMARQDLHGPLTAWLDLHRLLRSRGRFFIVFPARRLAELCAAMRERRLEPKVIRSIHPRPDKPASLVLVEAMKQGGTGVQVVPPLFVHEMDGSYTGEMRNIYGPAAAAE